MSSYKLTFSVKRLWAILLVSMVVMFGILLSLGGEIYQVKPPMPDAVKTLNGETVYTKAQIMRGQNI